VRDVNRSPHRQKEVTHKSNPISFVVESHKERVKFQISENDNSRSHVFVAAVVAACLYY
jgi:hypothetical protein